jgi:hypothetical protein
VTSSPKVPTTLWFGKEAEAAGADASLKVMFSYKWVSPDAARPNFKYDTLIWKR